MDVTRSTWWHKASHNAPATTVTYTFSPVVSWPTFQAFWAICAKEDLEMRQLDVTTAFLNAPLEEVIYMKLPPGFAAASNAVLRLWKALYELKQANKQWHKLLCRYLVAHSWTPSDANPSLWILQNETKVLAAFYVDDCQLAAKTADAADAIVASIMALWPRTYG